MIVVGGFGQMNEHSTNGFSKESPVQAPELVTDELAELRSLLLGVDSNKFNRIYEYLENQQIKPEDISRILPQAVVMRTLQDKQLVEAIVPTIEQAIESSVKKDLNVLSSAIFPIMGPSTRKAIATALDEMIQSLNQTLEHSLSVQSFKWRLEARQTGKSFAEVVLLRTLVYRVEQVFLIHKKTGLLLQHVVASKAVIQDPDLVSAMLTAIQDFVKDSFSVKKEEGLQTLKFGELTIWIEEGPAAVVAGIIRGNAPQELRMLFKDAIEKIHLRVDNELYNFQGETEPFDVCKPYLENCLEVRYKYPVKKNYTYAYALIGLVGLGLSIWGLFAFREQQRWHNFLEELSVQPGIAITKSEKQNGKYFITGMRDPLSIDPNTLLQDNEINPKNVVSRWQPYLSLEPQFIAQRANALLRPPKTVSLEVDNNGFLIPKGTAPRKWILETRRLWRFIPGVTKFEEQYLADLDISQLNLYKKQLEETSIFFQEGKTDILPSETSKLQQVAPNFQKILDNAKYLNKNVAVQIIGYTNSKGTEQENIQLSQARANQILSYLTSQGINLKSVRTIGLGSANTMNKKITQDDLDVNRRVNFKIFITDNRQ